MRIASLFLVCACSAASADTSATPYAVLDTGTGAFHLEVRTSPDQPPTHGVLVVDLTVTDKRAAPVVGAQVQVTPWMPAHGHGTSVTPTVTELGAGKYRVSNVDLYMPGSWQLRTSIGDAITDNVTIPVDVR